MIGRHLRIALIADELTRSCLPAECNITHLTPLNYSWVLRFWKPDLLLVESAWNGVRNRWKYRIASYTDYPERTNRSLAKVIQLARDLGIPSLFWNKEDSVHFDRFIASAKLFDHILTVDSNAVPRYRAVVDARTTVGTMMFAVQPALHTPDIAEPKIMRANFVGSYSLHMHDNRRQLQHMLFKAAADELGLTVFDRNSGRKSANYRYPANDISMEVKPAVPHAATVDIYRDYLVSLNVNTIQDSPTMFSRRLVEILGSGGLAVTTPALSVDALFAPYCHVVRCEEEARALFARLRRDGLSAADREMKAAGAEYVHEHHTWTQRLAQIRAVVGLAP